MNDDQKRTRTLERTLLRYSVALENGDLETVAAILEEAEKDAQLEKMLLELNDFYATEIEEITFEQDGELIREAIESALVSALPGAVVEPPPLTVGNVIARIHADAALRGMIDHKSLAATKAHQSADTPLPEELSLGRVSRLLQELGIEVGRRFQTLFRETALYMRMGRNQGLARKAVTYRQQESLFRPQFGLIYESKAPYAPSESPPKPPDPAISTTTNPDTSQYKAPNEKGAIEIDSGAHASGDSADDEEDT